MGFAKMLLTCWGFGLSHKLGQSVTTPSNPLTKVTVTPFVIVSSLTKTTAAEMASPNLELLVLDLKSI